MRKLVLAIIAIVFVGSIQAQRVKYGVKAGVNIASINGSEVNTDSRIGFHVGVVSEIEISDKFAIQPELIYTAQGAKVEDVSTIKLDYIAVPVSAKYYLAENFSLEAGPQFSFLINDKIDFKDDDVSDTDIDAETFDLGANIGLGYQLDSGIFFQSRYTFGITAFNENPDLKNGAFQVSVGYQF